MTGSDRDGRLARRLFVAVASLCAVAVALWLVPASVHIVRWPADGPHRVALLLPAWQLALGLVIATAAGVTTAIRWPRLALALAPLNLLWLWAVPYLPWVADLATLMLVFAGPFRWCVPAFIAAVFAARTVAWGRLMQTIARVDRRAVFAISLAIYALAGTYAVRTNGLVGDEPHYLIITESLLRDGDLQIENNHQQRDYRSFFNGELRPDYMQRGKNAAIYSIHAPGLGALVLPAYAVAGHYGVVVFIAFLAALTALAMFDVAVAAAGQTAAAVTWLVTCFTVPFVPYAWSIFPELPGALVVAWSVGWLLDRDERSLPVWGWRGLALAALPWLHTKFVVFVAIFALAFAVRLWPRVKAAAALLLPVGLSGLLWLYSFYAIYGRFDPEAPYGAYTSIYVLTRNIPHGLLGLFFDQKFGLLFYSPIYVAAIAGACMLWRRGDRFPVAVLTLVVAAFVGSTARLYMFWGGSSAPARFLVPVLPCLVPMVAVAVGGARAMFARSMVTLAAIVSLVLPIAGMIWPARLFFFSDPHGRSRLLEFFQGPSPLAIVLPTFTDPDWPGHVGALATWVLLLAAVGVIGAFASRRRPQRRDDWALVPGLVCLLLIAGSFTPGVRASAVREETARRSDLDAITRFDGDRFRTFDYKMLGRVAPEQWQRLTTIELTPESPVPEDGFVAGPLTLPPGRYELELWFNAARPGEGVAAVQAFNQATFGQVSGVLQNPVTIPFELPVTTRRVMVRVEDASVAAGVARLAIVPHAVVPPPLRETLPIRVVESIPGSARGYVAYTDGEAYPENGVFWSRGTAKTTVLVAPGGARRMTLDLSTGPKPGRVTVTVAGAERQLEMASDTPTRVSFELPADARLVPVSIQSSVMFRPGEVNPAIRDMRGLGCQVHIILE